MTTDAGLRDQIVAGYGFELDPFQLHALDALDAGRSVLVAAPTGSGKTVVAEYVIEQALASGGKVFYTTPIKALSNQKFGDLVARHGAERVGLLTGDNAINGDAPVVVMTTEVLRNMIYASSPSLRDLRWVVLDEVHYLQDAYRGPVWEEVIIHSPPEVRLVCLSATVSNAEELADWISTVRGPTTAVIEERRPVQLENLYLVGDRSSPELHLLPTLVDGRPNPEATRLDERAAPPGRYHDRRRTRFYTPRRVEVVERLARDDLLPAIYFIFSRAACDDAARACVDAGIRLTTPDERLRIRKIVEAHTDALGDDDLAVLDYGRWLDGLEQGIAAHHAGMVPPFKEAVESCFAQGLVKVVFATETLALGINMPARTVVIEKLSKFTGERHEFLTPGEYTQLTGRAGRRGIDTKGYAVVLWSPFVPFDQVAGLASSRTFRLTSAFRPTYNMAANLVQRYPAAEAHHLLNLSFAQYQADRSVVQMETRLERRQAELVRLLEVASCERGDVDTYRRLLDEAREARREASPRRAVEEALSRLRPGDVVEIGTARSGNRGVVLSFAHRRDDARLRVVTPHRKVLTLTAADFDHVPAVLGHVDLPTPYAPNNHGYQLQVARSLQRARIDRSHRAARASSLAGRQAAAADADDRVRDHPVARCPDRDEHVRALVRADRIRRETEDLKRSVKGRTESLARRFDRVLRVLEAWDYLDGWALTERGRRLARLYHECDLLVAEAVTEGLFDDLDPAAVASLLSCFTYEHRASTPAPVPWFPSGRVRQRAERVEATGRDLNADEDDAGLPLTRIPQPGFVPLAYGWAAGEALDDVLDDEDLPPGDFVRNVKLVIDLARQVAGVAPSPAVRDAADDAADRLFRGVVAASSAVGTAGELADVTTEPPPVPAGDEVEVLDSP